MFKVHKKTVIFGTEPEEIAVKIDQNGRRGGEMETYIQLNLGDTMAITPKEITIKVRGQWEKEMFAELLYKIADQLEE